MNWVLSTWEALPITKEALPVAEEALPVAKETLPVAGAAVAVAVTGSGVLCYGVTECLIGGVLLLQGSAPATGKCSCYREVLLLQGTECSATGSGLRSLGGAVGRLCSGICM